MMKLTSLSTALLLATLAGACASPPISKELRSARDAYAVAEKGIASELAPADLHLARQALDRAEEAFQKDDESMATRDLSYIAERSADLADILGRIEKAKRDKKDFKKKLAKFEKLRANMTRDELEAVKAKLEKKKTEFDNEHALRVSIESKLTSALSSLNNIGKVSEDTRGVVITLSGSVLFTTGRYALLPLAKTQLNEVAKALSSQGYKHIIVEGYTDSRGSESTNRSLSLKRANSVRTHLISQGIAASKISADGLGEGRPIASNKTAEGRANNRRVELIVTPK